MSYLKYLSQNKVCSLSKKCLQEMPGAKGHFYNAFVFVSQIFKLAIMFENIVLKTKQPFSWNSNKVAIITPCFFFLITLHANAQGLGNVYYSELRCYLYSGSISCRNSCPRQETTNKIVNIEDHCNKILITK